MPRVRKSVVPETNNSVEISNFHNNPTYESTLDINRKVEVNARSGNQDLDCPSYREMIHRRVQLPERHPTRKFRQKVFVDPETDNVGSANCHINPTYESTLNINCKSEENARSDNKELDRLSHHEMVHRRIRLPEGCTIRKPHSRISNVSETDDSGDSDNYINPALESTLNVNRKIGKNVNSGIQELGPLSDREMIRRSIQLTERGPMCKPRVRMTDVPETGDSEESDNYVNTTFESDFYLNCKVEKNASSGDIELDRLSHCEMIHRSIQQPESGGVRKPRVRMHNVPETENSRESNNYINPVFETDDSGESDNYDNPTFETDSNVKCEAKGNARPYDEELDRLSYREMIRRSIQLPERLLTPRKRGCCKILDKYHKEERLFIAYLLLIILFTMTFCSIGLSIIIRTVSMEFFSDCWMLTIALAFLTVIIGIYICWEDEIFRSPRPRQEEAFIEIEMVAFP